VQYGLLVDVHEILYWCHVCDRPYVLETETPA
jgi:hypothetical protein